MTQRFNPPPGWQVPPGFSPLTGWQPDSSWPPAPAGWNFWIDGAATQLVGAAPYQPQAVPPVHRLKDQLKSAIQQMVIGVSLLAVAIVVNAYSLLNPGGGRSTNWWGLLIVGVMATVFGVVAYRKAKKSISEATVAASGGLYGGGMGSNDYFRGGVVSGDGIGGERTNDLYK